MICEIEFVGYYGWGIVLIIPPYVYNLEQATDVLLCVFLGIYWGRRAVAQLLQYMMFFLYKL